MGSNEDREWTTHEEKRRIVFIGRHLPKEVLEEGISLLLLNKLTEFFLS